MKTNKLILLLLASALLGGCTSHKQSDERMLYVSIMPLRSLVTGIVGDDFDVRVLVPAGASPETFEPTPRQFVDLNRAQMIFNVGLIDFETTLLNKIEAQEKIVNLSRGIRLLAGSCSHGTHKPEAAAQGEAGGHDLLSGDGHGHETGNCETHAEESGGACCAGHCEGHDKEENGHSHAHGVDPHIWTSPKALRQMAANAYEAIRAAYPDSVKYADNYHRLQQQLEELDARTAEKIARSGVEYFLIYHPALTYYARDYGLRQVAIEDDGKEPSARRLAQLIRQAREDGVGKVFYQSQFPASAVEVIARDLRAERVAIDPLAEDVVGNIDRITDQIVMK